jgi:hypothetical protein
VSNPNLFDYELDVYNEIRWWSLLALCASSEIFYPEGLPDLLEPLIAGIIPPEPTILTRRLGIHFRTGVSR